MLVVSYAPGLVIASILVAIMAAFTSLRLTTGLSALDSQRRKVRVSQAAIALGGGIWSMHFVGMLAVQVPVPIFYDPLRTLGSALIAILITGSALMALHFGVRTRARIVIAGVITGIGITCMHYLGMSAISGNCVVSYNPFGVLLAIGISIAASIFAVNMAYRTRSLAATTGGAVLLGLSISAMHYVAMLFTTFSLGDVALERAQAISSYNLALIVALSAFVICGLFLLLAVPGDGAAKATSTPAPAELPAQPPAGPPAEPPAGQQTNPGTPAVALSRAGDTAALGAQEPPEAMRIPYERDKTLRFLPAHAIHFVQADGHYSRIANDSEVFFCPWSISRLEKSLDSTQFLRTHRSYLVNTSHIKGFRRDGDKGVCIVGGATEAEVPVSRSHVAKIQGMFTP